MIDWALGILALFALLVTGVPIALAMTIVALAGISILLGVDPTLAMLGQVFYDNAMSYTLSVMPLFVLMGNFVVKAGLADDLYEAANAWLRHYRGGLAMATIVACGGFSSVCGSSLATAATMARVSMPAMRYGYSDGLATGTIAAGGTLGILIPPSIVLVLYGVITRTDIGKLFLAGILPGIVGVIGYLIAVRLSLLRSDEHAQKAEPLPWSTRLRATGGIAGVLILFVGVIGGIYLGAFTANEAAGVGTPPVGLNVFVLKAVLPEVPTRTIFRGVLPFVLIDVARILLLIGVPSMALLIPATMQ